MTRLDPRDPTHALLLRREVDALSIDADLRSAVRLGWTVTVDFLDGTRETGVLKEHPRDPFLYQFALPQRRPRGGRYRDVDPELVERVAFES